MRNNYSNQVAGFTDTNSKVIANIILRKADLENSDLILNKNDFQLLSDINELASLKSRIKELEVKEKLLENSLKNVIGNRERVVFDGVVIATLKEFTRESFNSKKLQQEFPDVHKKFLGYSNYKVLKIKEVVAVA